MQIWSNKIEDNAVKMRGSKLTSFGSSKDIHMTVFQNCKTTHLFISSLNKNFEETLKFFLLGSVLNLKLFALQKPGVTKTQITTMSGYHEMFNL